MSKIKVVKLTLKGAKIMSKKLCKLVSDGFLEDHTKKYTHMVNEPKYICMKCGRVANDDDALCHSKKIKDKKESKKTKASPDEIIEKRVVKLSKKAIRNKSDIQEVDQKGVQEVPQSPPLSTED